LKPEVAAQYFSPVVGEVEQQEQPEVETDETDS